MYRASLAERGYATAYHHICCGAVGWASILQQPRSSHRKTSTQDAQIHHTRGRPTGQQGVPVQPVAKCELGLMCASASRIRMAPASAV